MSTSKPKSANALAMTFWPRSWPSCPIFATRIRGRRRAFGTCRCEGACGQLRPPCPRHVHCLPSSAAVHALDAPRFGTASWRPKTRSPVASLISPTVAFGPRGVDRQRQQVALSPLSALRRSAPSQRADSYAPPRRSSPLSDARLSSCAARTAAVVDRAGPPGCLRLLRRVPVHSDDDLLAPNRCGPGSGRRPLRCAAWAGPDSMALVMPPSASTSRMCVPRRWFLRSCREPLDENSCPPQGSTEARTCRSPPAG